MLKISSFEFSNLFLNAFEKYTFHWDAGLVLVGTCSNFNVPVIKIQKVACLLTPRLQPTFNQFESKQQLLVCHISH